MVTYFSPPIPHYLVTSLLKASATARQERGPQQVRVFSVNVKYTWQHQLFFKYYLQQSVYLCRANFCGYSSALGGGVSELQYLVRN